MSKMKLVFRPAEDKGFVEQLTRRNMAAYYARLGIDWDCSLFDKNWNEFESYELAVNGCAVGVLRLSHDDRAYYIRDLQLEQAWQRQGLGSQAIGYAAEVARRSGIRLLRLRVFSMNPATALYERLGFRICKTEGGTHSMERELY
ncbi:GNAT family N-acetyltransferase [Marinobacterium aestuariivivens]|uniref:GNAT family N-acetyltransferase n=1 Tax=Marinobacterium aestuariivivens TaxID=1698799 RepID=A0ABW2A462_9GAMM